jgi:hypothetical protein
MFLALALWSALRAALGTRADLAVENLALLRQACAEDRLVHLRVVNTLWLAPAAVEYFARAWRAKKRER